jgi:hypothetical protein
MNRSKVLAIVFVAFLLVPLTTEAWTTAGGKKLKRSNAPQGFVGCLQCIIRSNCWYCISNSGQGGGNTCQADCTFCNLGTVCKAGGFGCSPRDSSLVEPLSFRRILELAPNTLREIAESHPRFGMALALLNKSGFSGGESTLYLSPVDVSSKDVETYLNPKRVSDKFLRRRNQQAKLVNALIADGKMSPVVYEVSVSTPDSPVPTLTLRAISGQPFADPAYSSLEIKFFYSGDATVSRRELPIKTEWELKN